MLLLILQFCWYPRAGSRKVKNKTKHNGAKKEAGFAQVDIYILNYDLMWYNLVIYVSFAFRLSENTIQKIVGNPDPGYFMIQQGDVWRLGLLIDRPWFHLQRKRMKSTSFFMPYPRNCISTRVSKKAIHHRCTPGCKNIHSFKSLFY